MLLVGALMAGCGGDDSEPAGDTAGARAAAKRLFDALEKRDGDKACGELSRELTRRVGDPCPRRVLRALIGPEAPRDSATGRVRADPDRATVSVTWSTGHGAAERVVRQTVRLGRAGAGWRVDAVTGG